ncbi:uncharacterized protein LOC128248835 [Octopus bimaculoides]|uniref:uncharacterized protein LOC128248835 n=1 Tax=Octopus bimaculoides TaxID=37653 RepID=UPI0022E943F6|nr:uncharacterized protein LOC128248835 [Octopus bimaculoides]
MAIPWGLNRTYMTYFFSSETAGNFSMAELRCFGHSLSKNYNIHNMEIFMRTLMAWIDCKISEKVDESAIHDDLIEALKAQGFNKQAETLQSVNGLYFCRPLPSVFRVECLWNYCISLVRDERLS